AVLAYTASTCPSVISEWDRVDCYPESGASEGGCNSRGCMWCEASVQGPPWCFYDNAATAGRYKSRNEVSLPNGYRITLAKIHTTTLFGDDVDTVTLDVSFDTEARLHIKFYDAANERFEVPLPINGADATAPADPLYDIQFFNDPSFYFQVIKKSTGTVLLDTSLGGLTFSDQFLQIATRLPSTTLHFFLKISHFPSYQHNFDWESFGMWARDQPPDPGANLYGTHPFYISMEDDGNSHGVLFLNSNAQDVTTTPAPGLVYRTIGGVLDMYVFLGPEPNRVVEQYNTAIGTPFLPPYWSLGFQLCRYGYGDLNTVKETVARMDAYDIPLVRHKHKKLIKLLIYSKDIKFYCFYSHIQDVQYGDIDYMDEQRDFTYDTSNYAGLRDYVRELQAGGKHYVIILGELHLSHWDMTDPCITQDDPPGTYPAYDDGASMNVFVTTSDGFTPASGKVWPPGKCAFPDYTNPDTETWWTDQCMDFHKTINFDGLWIVIHYYLPCKYIILMFPQDMNEPANFVTGSTEGCASNNLNNPPYMPKIWGNVLAEKTMCPDHRHKLGNHYDVHNLYGWSQSNVTIKSAVASTGKRPFVISRSTFVGSGQWAAHWLGDNNADWHDLRMSIIGMLEFNMFGIPYVGADICGFNGSPSEELCERWMELGAFYPFSRNHNGLGYKEQDPAAWGDEFAARSRAVLRTRYTLLPYLYELFYHAHTDGTGIVRPLSFEFANDKTTATIDEQFMWGAGLLLSPALYEGIKTVSAYFPDARWFNYYDGVEVGARGTTASVDAPLGTIPIHVRGGHIIPTQEPASNT
uniref:P-type domain-containing protein n=1 Tax=Ciona savignyi TaxID=51511 RepID=H2YDF7_CIOSA